MALLLKQIPTVVTSRLPPTASFADEHSFGVDPPIRRAIIAARSYLRKRAGEHKSVTNTHVVIEENFAQFLIQEATGDSSLVKVSQSERLYNFFDGNGQLTTINFPCDLDTTSIGTTVLGAPDKETLNSILDEMLLYRNEQGILQVYFDKTRKRVDPTVCVNALTLFYKSGRGSDIPQTLAYAYEVLETREYLQGTRYYYSAENFLYLATRFIVECNSQEVREEWIPLLQSRLMELRFSGKSNDPLSTAMRILCATELELLPDPSDITDLLNTQKSEGQWIGGWFYKYGSSGILIENPGLTTAYALKALGSLS